MLQLGSGCTKLPPFFAFSIDLLFEDDEFIVYSMQLGGCLLHAVRGEFDACKDLRAAIISSLQQGFGLLYCEASCVCLYLEVDGQPEVFYRQFQKLKIFA
jgi:hypothetical protein